MKKIFTCAFIHLVCFASAQAPNWEWARAETGVSTSLNSTDLICVDAAGNSYVTGFFQWSATFGSITLTSNASGSGANLYLVKYNPWGSVVWAQNAGGHSQNEGMGVAVDDSGNVFLTGYFGDTIVFGSTTFISPAGYGLAFLVKYNPAGNVVWAKQLGTGSGFGGVTAKSVATDNSGNIFVTGYFRTPSVTFGSITLTSASNGVYQDAFLVKCDPSGNVVWAKSAGNSGATIPFSVTTDAAGNSYITGYFTSPSLSFGFSTITNNGNYNGFLTRYDPSGNVVWARGFGGTGPDYANAVSSNATGYCYVVGTMRSLSMTLGTFTITNSDTTGSTSDIFLVRYAPNGTVMWARSFGGNDLNYDAGNAVVSDSIGNAYVTGYFSDDTISFGSVSSNTVTGSSNIFVTKFSPSGNALWAKAVGDTGNAEGTSIAINHSGDCYITGYFNGATLDFGSIILSNPLMYGQFYIAKTGEEAGVYSLESLNNDISIFPNPSNGNFNVEMNSEGFSLLKGETEIEIYDLLGKTIFKSEIVGSRSEIDLSESANGIYFYRIFNSGEIIGAGKMVVE